MWRRLVTLLALPWMPLAATLLGVVLSLPSLGDGLLADDYFQRSLLLGVGNAGAGSSPLFDMFSFVSRGPRLEAAMDLGMLGWWTHPQISIAFFRPLTAFTHELDYTLWPDAIFAQHLHNLFWYALAVAAVAALYREVEGGTAVAGLAAILFAVDDAHAMCVAWLANRHALVALVFGVFALLAHVRWRRTSGLAWFAAAVGSLTLALLSGEAGLGAAAYVVAWELAMEDAPWRQRAAALLPYILLVAGWRAIYEQLDYGSTGSLLYVDPGHYPLAFLRALAERWPILQLTQWLRLPADLYIFLPRAVQVAIALISAAGCVGLVWLLTPLVVARRTARFWATGMCLALVPLCAAFPMDRLLLFSAVGAFGLLAMLAEQVGLLSSVAAAPGALRRVIAQLLLVIHGPLAALLLVARIAALPSLGALVELAALTAPADGQAPRQTYVFVTGQEFPIVYLPIIRQLESPSTAPRRVALLASMFNDNEVYREAEATLVIRAREGFLKAPIDQLMRSSETPFLIGERIERRDFTAEIRSITADGRPAEVAFHFRTPLESRELRWLAWDQTGVQPFQLPPIGARVELPALSVLRFLSLRARKVDGENRVSRRGPPALQMISSSPSARWQEACRAVARRGARPSGFQPSALQSTPALRKKQGVWLTPRL
jgi:hypothetical protein